MAQLRSRFSFLSLSNPIANRAMATNSAISETPLRSAVATPDEPARKTQPSLMDGEPLCSTMQWYAPPRRPYSRQELLADRSVNFLGAGLAWLATLWLGYASWAANDPPMKQAGFWLHGAGLITMLNLSALYHYWAWDWRYGNELLTLDHIGISAMISGTYAPIMYEGSCYRVFIFVCCLGLAVVPMEAVRLWQLRQPRNETSSKNWSCIDILHIIRYLVMGWACVIVGPTLGHVLATEMLYLMAAGGVLYTGGVFIFVKDRIQFHLAIWHAVVLMASICFYLANLLVLVGRPN